MPVAIFPCFLLRRISVPNEDKTLRGFCGFFTDQKKPDGPKNTRRGGPGWPAPTRARQRHPGAAWWVLGTSGIPSTASNAYKFSNIRKPQKITLDSPLRRRNSLYQQKTTGGIPVPCRRGESISGGHLHHPGGGHDEEGVIHPWG